MLDAFIQKGARRILKRKSDEHRNNKEEDAITSMVFSPLQFMTADQALACFKAFLPSELDKIIEGRAPRSGEIVLWRRLDERSGEKATRCFPDLVAKFDFDTSNPLVLIGEMKWESPITAEQIKRERDAAAQEFTLAELFVFAITKSPHNRIAGCNTHPMTWTDIHRKLTQFEERGARKEASVIWASKVSKFLAVAEQLIFTGFELKVDDDLGFDFSTLPSVIRPFVFFEKSRHFSGFQSDYGRLPPLEASVAFFKRSQP